MKNIIFRPGDDLLRHDSRLSCLPMGKIAFQLDNPCYAISDAFKKYPHISGVLVFDAENFHSLISRKRFIEIMNQPYSKELFSQRKIRRLVKQFNDSPLIFPAETYIGKAVEDCLKRPGDQLSEPLVVKDADDYYILDAHQLLISHAHVFSTTVKKLRQEITHSNRLREELERASRAAEEMARLDGLTGIPNRRRMDEYLSCEWDRSVRQHSSLSVILIDIDHFKNFNDTYGHQAGDEALVKVAACLKQQIHRPADMVARYGGEEFMSVLPDTPIEGALSLAEKMRLAIAAMKIENRGSLSNRFLSISCGISCRDGQDVKTLTGLIQEADEALYLAKKQGRNRVFLRPQPPKGAANQQVSEVH